METPTRILCKRVYDPVDENDGVRVLVDGSWPRGIAKRDLHAERWCREVAPTMALRKWFGHDPARWREFLRRYHDELRQHPEGPAGLLRDGAGDTLTLLYAARDRRHNNAEALRLYLLDLIDSAG